MKSNIAKSLLCLLLGPLACNQNHETKNVAHEANDLSARVVGADKHDTLSQPKFETKSTTQEFMTDEKAVAEAIRETSIVSAILGGEGAAQKNNFGGMASSASSELRGGLLGSNLEKNASYGFGYGDLSKKSKMSRGRFLELDKNFSSRDESRNNEQNPVTKTIEDHISTFAVDVDTASYAISRRFIQNNQMPPAQAVRVEEFVNYFKYNYQGPTDDLPFAVHMDMAPSPFAKGKHLLRVGVQGKQLSNSERKPSHLTFLVDVSGSMNSGDKLGLTKKALRVLVQNLRDEDTVSLVTYAGNTRVVLAPTRMEHKAEIMTAIEDLSAGGSTAMGSGIDLAYTQAAANLSPTSESRVIVLSDGDANVGRTGHKAILKTIEGKVSEGVTLSTIGFGMGNYKDTMMEQLANKGNGNYYYIDSISEAKKVFQEQLGGTLEVIAKDVKIQVDFDQSVVDSYRLVGYENRDIADVDFRNDKVDAGEIGAGHSVTAIYELTLKNDKKAPAIVRVRHKKPNGKRAIESAYPFASEYNVESFASASNDFKFAISVMATAEKLRQSALAKKWRWEDVKSIAKASSLNSSDRNEFVVLLSKIDPSKLTMAK